MTNPVIVLDIGQFSTKCGFAGTDNPSLVFFTMVGKPKYRNLDAQYGGKEQEVYVGTEIESLGLYKISYPIEKGVITDWSQFEKVDVNKDGTYSVTISAKTKEKLDNAKRNLRIENNDKALSFVLENYAK